MLTEHSKVQKIQDVFCCVVLHNLMIRFREDDNTSPTLRAEMDAYYNDLLREVDLEIALFPPERAPDAGTATVSGITRRSEVMAQLVNLAAF
jgi:hypothetical protein